MDYCYRCFSVAQGISFYATKHHDRAYVLLVLDHKYRESGIFKNMNPEVIDKQLAEGIAITLTDKYDLTRRLPLNKSSFISLE